MAGKVLSNNNIYRRERLKIWKNEIDSFLNFWNFLHVALMQYKCQNESLKLIWPYLLEIEGQFGIIMEKQKNYSLEVYYISYTCLPCEVFYS